MNQLINSNLNIYFTETQLKSQVNSLITQKQIGTDRAGVSHLWRIISLENVDNKTTIIRRLRIIVRKSKAVVEEY